MVLVTPREMFYRQKGGSGHYTSARNPYEQEGGAKRRKSHGWSRRKKTGTVGKRVTFAEPLEQTLPEALPQGIPSSSGALERELDEIDDIIESAPLTPVTRGKKRKKRGPVIRVRPRKSASTKKRQKSATAGKRRSVMETRYANLPMPQASEIVLRRQRGRPTRSMPTDAAGRRAFLDTIRPNTKKRQTTRATHLGRALEAARVWRRGDKGTLLHTHTTGWKMHGANVGAPRPGLKAAILRESIIRGLTEYKRKGTAYKKQLLQRKREAKRARGG